MFHSVPERGGDARVGDPSPVRKAPVPESPSAGAHHRAHDSRAKSANDTDKCWDRRDSDGYSTGFLSLLGSTLSKRSFRNGTACMHTWTPRTLCDCSQHSPESPHLLHFLQRPFLNQLRSHVGTRRERSPEPRPEGRWRGPAVWRYLLQETPRVSRPGLPAARARSVGRQG